MGNYHHLRLSARYLEDLFPRTHFLLHNGAPAFQAFVALHIIRLDSRLAWKQTRPREKLGRSGLYSREKNEESEVERETSRQAENLHVLQLMIDRKGRQEEMKGETKLKIQEH